MRLPAIQAFLALTTGVLLVTVPCAAAQRLRKAQTSPGDQTPATTHQDKHHHAHRDFERHMLHEEHNIDHPDRNQKVNLHDYLEQQNAAATATSSGKIRGLADASQDEPSPQASGSRLRGNAGQAQEVLQKLPTQDLPARTGGALRGGPIQREPVDINEEEDMRMKGQQQECSGGQVWKECARPCDATCSVPNPMCATVCVARCECPASAPVWDGSKCITASECPAKRGLRRQQS